MGKISSSESKEHLNSGNKYPTWRKLSEASKAVILATLLVSSSCSCEKEDTTPPTIRIEQSNTKDVESGSKIEVRGGSDVYLGGKPVAICTDNEGSPRTTFTYDGKNISVVEKDGILVVLSTDNAGNKSEKRQQITVKKAPIIENEAPKITPEKYSDGSSIKVGGGFRFFHEGNSISIESQGKTEKCFSYSDRETSTENLKPTFTIDGQSIEYGKWYTEGKTFSGVIEDDGTIENQDKKSEAKKATITYTLNSEILDNDVFSGLDKLNSLQLKVWEDTDLLNGVNGINGWTISKVEIEQNGQRTEISSTNGKYNYTPTQEGNVNIIITGTTEAGVSYEVKSNPIEVKENVKEYNAVQPEKEDIYSTFNNENINEYKRRGIYEIVSLTQSLNNRKSSSIFILGEFSGLDNPDPHLSIIYNNIKTLTNDPNNISDNIKTSKWDEILQYIDNNHLQSQPLIFSQSSGDIIGGKDLSTLETDPSYNALEQLKNSDYVAIFKSIPNIDNINDYCVNVNVKNPDLRLSHKGKYGSASLDTNDDNMFSIIGGQFNASPIKFGVYESGGKYKTGATTYISDNNEVSPLGFADITRPLRGCDPYTDKSSFPTAAAAAIFKDCFDLFYSVGCINNVSEMSNIWRHCFKKVPCTRQDYDRNNKIIDNVDNGFIVILDLNKMLSEYLIPFFLKNSINEQNKIILHKDEHLNIAYSGPGTMYKIDNGKREDTSGINPSDFIDKDQIIDFSITKKYNKDEQTYIIFFTKKGKEIIRFPINID